MAKRRRTLYSQYSPQAVAEAVLRTSPERRGLRALLLQAQSERDSSIAAAHTTSGVLRSSIRQADPHIARLYANAGTSLQAASSQIAPATGVVGDSAHAEAAAAQARNIEAGTAARKDLTDQSLRAAAGDVFATRAASDRYRSDTGKVLTQLTGLDQEQGLYAATQLGRLVDAAKGRGVTKRGQTLSHQDRQAALTYKQDTAAAKKQAAAAKPRHPKKWAPDGAQTTLRKTIGKARTPAETFKAEGVKRSEAEALLSAGQKARPVFDNRQTIPGPGGPKAPKVKNPNYGKKVFGAGGTQKMTGSVPAIDDPLALAVALDVAYDGHISRRNQRLLHKNGYRISPLGLVTYGQARRKAQQKLPKKNNATERGINRGDLAGPPSPRY